MKDKLKVLKSRWWFKWLVIGVVIRLLLMPITLHPDLLGQSFVAYFFAYDGQLNIYDFLAKLPSTHPLVTNIGVADIFIYPPLAYYTLGIFRVLVKPFADPNFLPWTLTHLDSIYSNPNLFFNIFLFKLPLLFIDIGVAFGLSGLFKKLSNKRLVFMLWMINPVTIYATFMMGQFDVLPLLFTVLAALFLAKGKNNLAMVCLGLGGSYKLYPLLLLPAAAFVTGKSTLNKIKYLIVGLLPFIISIAPFIRSAAFRAMAFSPKDQKMLFMRENITGAEYILPFMALLVVIYAIAFYQKRKVNIEVYFISILLLIYSVSHYHPQWMIWVSPFVIWELVRNKFRYWQIALSLFLIWLVLTFLFEPSLSVGLFSPLSPIFRNTPDLSVVFAKYGDVFQFKSIIRSVFAGLSLFYIYQLFKQHVKKTN